MILNTNNGIVIFVHIPRCSGTSIEHSLLNGQLVDDRIKHLNAKQIKHIVGEEIWNQAFKFAIIRNPFDRMASLYVTEEAPFCLWNIHHKSNSPWFMSNFLIDHYRPMPWEHGSQCSDYINEELDLIIKYENRKDGIDILNDKLKEYGLHVDSSVKKRNHPNKDKDFMRYFDAQSIEIMHKMFADDIEKWYNEN